VRSRSRLRERPFASTASGQEATKPEPRRFDRSGGQRRYAQPRRATPAFPRWRRGRLPPNGRGRCGERPTLAFWSVATSRSSTDVERRSPSNSGCVVQPGPTLSDRAPSSWWTQKGPTSVADRRRLPSTAQSAGDAPTRKHHRHEARSGSREANGKSGDVVRVVAGCRAAEGVSRSSTGLVPPAQPLARNTIGPSFRSARHRCCAHRGSTVAGPDGSVLDENTVDNGSDGRRSGPRQSPSLPGGKWASW